MVLIMKLAKVEGNSYSHLYTTATDMFIVVIGGVSLLNVAKKCYGNCVKYKVNREYGGESYIIMAQQGVLIAKKVA